MFRIFLLHTTLDSAKGDLPIESISISELPKVDYYALGHLHIAFCEKNCIYPGPIFPNNFEELEKLEHGSFYIVESSSMGLDLRKIELGIKSILVCDIELSNAFTATDKIISELAKFRLEDKIILLKLKGKLENGKTSDINFSQIENFVKDKKAYFFMKNISRLKVEEAEIHMEVTDMDKMEEQIILLHKEKNPTKFNIFIDSLINSLQIEKQEDEKNQVFEERLVSELKKVLKF
jgi:DNA repair exonuclease SbcCD nuclease subunit